MHRVAPTLVLVIASLAGCAPRASVEPNAQLEPASGAEQPSDDAPADGDETTGVSADAKPELPPVDGFFMAEGAPAPTACSVDTDCMGDTIPDPKNPCCQDPYSLRPYAKAYRNFVNEWRTAECVDHECPPPPAPSMPPDCAFDVRCEAGTCKDACGN